MRKIAGKLTFVIYRHLLQGLMVVILATGCGSPLENPITNEEGCQRLKTALDNKCTGDSAIGWLNCEFLPGCPDGTVEGKDIDSCVNAISFAPSCESAKDLQCSIRKTNCHSAKEDFDPAWSFATACQYIVDALNEESCGKGGEAPLTTSNCSDYLEDCVAGAFKPSDVQNCVTKVTSEDTCSSAQAKITSCTIQNKYCLK